MRRTIVTLALLGCAACAEDVVTAIDESGTGEQESTGPCMGADDPWTTARTDFPYMETMWSDGEQFIAHRDRDLLVYDGETMTLLENATPSMELDELEALSINEAWLVRPLSIEFWNGSNLSPVLSEVHHPFIEVAADGRVWALAHRPCTVDTCQPRVWERQGDGSWVEHIVPKLQKAISFAVAPDGELWIGDDNNLLAHRRDGQWTIEDLEALGWDGTFRPRLLDVDADGHMWTGYDDQTRIELAHWSPADGWSFYDEGLFLSDYDHFHASTLIADGDDVIVARPYAEHPLRRSIAGGPFADLIHPDELGSDPLLAVSGSNHEFGLLSYGPRFRTIDPQLEPAGIETLADMGAVRVHVGSAATVDAPFSARDSTLIRFDGERWGKVLELPASAPGGPYIRDVFADSDDSGWLIAGERYYSTFAVTGKQLYRWEGEQATLADWDPPNQFQPQWLWGTGPDRVWLVGTDPGDDNMLVWRFDGASWQLVHEDPVAAAAITGDAEGLFIAQSDGTVLAWQADEWQDLGQATSAPYEPMDVLGRTPGDTLVRVGTELLLGSQRWDGEQWSAAPELPDLRHFSNDGFGRAWASSDDGHVYRHDGLGPADQGWVRTELDVDLYDEQLSATADGVVVYARTSTSVFRWSCD